MAIGRTLVFVHGKGGPELPATWLVPLNAGLTSLGYPRLAAPSDRIVTVMYLTELLAGDEGDEPPVSWERPTAEDRQQGWADYLVRRDAMAVAIEQARNEPGWLDAEVMSDTFVADAVATAMTAVGRYAHSRRHRHAAWRAVIAQLPTHGSVVIVAHSLGSIVLLDLLHRLPPDLHVDLLVTIGSPMGVRLLRSHNGGLDRVEEFPVDRVGAWVNVFDPGDVVTVGRGASEYFPAALDEPVHTGASHSLAAYLTHPVTACAVGLALFGPPVRGTAPNAPARLLDPRWDALLLNFAFTQALWSTCHTDKWGFRRTLDTARRTLAQRTVDNAGRQYESLVRRARSRTGQEATDLLLQASASAVGPGRSPSTDDLLVHATGLMQGRYGIDDLIIASVDLLLSPPLPPFDIDIDRAHSRAALAALLDAVSIPGGAHSGAAFADHIAAAVKEARDALSETGFPWGRVLIGAGIGMLALTGVGLVIAAPAGLAGAAAIASTLATFGPGGMVGGIATLTALTGVATAVTVAGTALELVPGDPGYEAVREAMASQLADLPSPQLRTSVAGMIAVLSAQRRLDRPVHASAVEELLLKTQAIVIHETSLHEAIAPGRSLTRDWHAKARILRRALTWLADQGDEVGLPELERRHVRASIESAATD
ncbi:MAG: hypothetical protein IPO93_10830 [Actinobacteria bacterium]|jgi:hypothetical protein|nr:hypothetical protein [Actinomycetota bacterium]